MKRRYIIFAPSYLETDGGSIVLHKLCSLLNSLGIDSYLYPNFETYEINKINFFRTLILLTKSMILGLIRPYKLNKSFNTKIFTNNLDIITKYDIVIYPETTFGNPLNAKNVIRWLLHKPGFHTNKVYYGKGELLFKYGTGNNTYKYHESKLSEGYLKIIYYPLEYYNRNYLPTSRKGTAYCLRKGKHKKIQHDLTDSILIDGKSNSIGKSHKEVSEIFKKVNIFISYDTYTAYSKFAALCGCISIVVPDENITKEEWNSREYDRYGIAYGFSEDELTKAVGTAHLLKEQILHEEEENIENVKKFIEETEEYFEK
jgi:hypothetical protein